MILFNDRIQFLIETIARKTKNLARNRNFGSVDSEQKAKIEIGERGKWEKRRVFAVVAGRFYKLQTRRLFHADNKAVNKCSRSG